MAKSFKKISDSAAAREQQSKIDALLSFTCGEDVSDEEFISAVCKIWKYGSGIAPEAPVETPRLPQVGEKGAA